MKAGGAYSNLGLEGETIDPTIFGFLQVLLKDFWEFCSLVGRNFLGFKICEEFWGLMFDL